MAEIVDQTSVSPIEKFFLSVVTELVYMHTLYTLYTCIYIHRHYFSIIILRCACRTEIRITSRT